MKQLCEGEFPLEIKGPESQRDLAGLLIPRCSPLLVICALHPPTTAASADRSLSQGVLRSPLQGYTPLPATRGVTFSGAPTGASHRRGVPFECVGGQGGALSDQGRIIRSQHTITQSPE